MREYESMFVWLCVCVLLGVLGVNVTSCAKVEQSTRVEMEKYRTDLQKYCIDKNGTWVRANDQCILK
jgi:hypothetical protein